MAAAQKAGGGRNRWDGVLPAQTLLVEWPDGQDTPLVTAAQAFLTLRRLDPKVRTPA